MSLYQRACRVIPGGVDSPVRAFGSVGGDPVFIARASGPYLYDTDGREYVDAVGSWGPALLGHAHINTTMVYLHLTHRTERDSRALIESLCAGLPCVLSAVAAEGMDLEDGRDVLIGSDPADMAAKIVRLHGEAAEWTQLSAASLAFARDRLSLENYKQSLRAIIVGLELPADVLPVWANDS